MLQGKHKVIRTIIPVILGFSLACGGGGSSKPAPPPPPPPPPPASELPRITSFSPEAGVPGTGVTLHGAYFTPGMRVEFGRPPVGTHGPRTAQTDQLAVFRTAREVFATVPQDGVTGPITLIAQNGARAVSEKSFQRQEPPQPPPAPRAAAIDNLHPHQARPWEEVTLRGTGFASVKSVWFNLSQAAAWHLVNDGELKATVPLGATSGTVWVQTASGRVRYGAPFTVLPLPAPVITGLEPAEGRPGTRVTIHGTPFTGVAQVSFGGVAATRPIEVESDTLLHAHVPDGAVTGPVTLTGSRPPATSGHPFKVLPPPPTITGIHPHAAGVGTRILIRGTHFQPHTTVAFSGAAAVAVAPDGGELGLPVAPGAVTGPVTVTTSGGEVRHPFVVLPAPPSVNVMVHGWYVTQATQRLDRSVPLVANRDGVLRVFLRANEANTARPEVRVTLLGGPAPWQRVIPAPGPSVPTAFTELDLNASWNLPIPAAVLVPGARIRLEVDPGRSLPGVEDAARSLEADLGVRPGPIIRITLVPVDQAISGLTGEVVGPGRNLASWAGVFRKLYPVAEVDLKVDPPLVTLANLDNRDANHDEGWIQLLGELEQRRFDDWEAGDTGRYVYGVVRRTHDAGTLGLTPTQSNQAAGWDDPAGYATTFAHEMGHALGLAHAPYGLHPDDHQLGDWPVADPAYAEANLGAVGMDTATLALKAPGLFKDIMSYAPPAQLWVSDFSYKKVLRHLEAYPVPLPPPPMLANFTRGPAGTLISVTGRFLDTVFEVFFEGPGGSVPASFEHVDPHTLWVTVPAPAPVGLRLVLRGEGGRVDSAAVF